MSGIGILRGFRAGVLAATLLLGSQARAQSAVEVAPMQRSTQPPVYVQVHAGGRRFVVISRHAKREPEKTLAECEGECSFWAWPANYLVRVQLDDRLATVALRVRRGGRFELIPEDSGARDAGLFLGIVGIPVTFVGVLVTAIGLLETSCDSSAGQSCSGRSSLVLGGLATLGGGAAMTSVGWVLFSHNGWHFDFLETTPTANTLRLGPALLSNAGLGLGFSRTY